MRSIKNLFPKQNKESNKTGIVPIKSSVLSQAVPWHDFTIRELFLLSKQNSWNDVQNDLSSLVITLATYNPPKSFQILNSTISLSNANNIQQKSSKTENPENECKIEDSSSNNISNNANDASSKLLEIFREEFNCDICMDIYVEPLTLACGHTFCRLCVIQIQSKCEKKCPLCKAVCHINANLHSSNVIIAKCSQRLHPNYAQRMADLQQEKKLLSATIAAFILNIVRYPGQLLHLHLFEMRYLHMINRAISSGKRFAYICQNMNHPSKGGCQPYANDIALLIYVKECQFLPNGRCYMVGVCEKRILVASSWVESGTQGLWMVRYEDYMDDKFVNDGNVNRDQKQKHKKHKMMKYWVILLKEFIAYIYSLSKNAHIERECGQRQYLQNENMGNINKWSFFVCGLIVYHFGQTNISLAFIRKVFKTCDVVERIQFCFNILKGKSSEWR